MKTKIRVNISMHYKYDCRGNSVFKVVVWVNCMYTSMLINEATYLALKRHLK